MKKPPRHSFTKKFIIIVIIIFSINFGYLKYKDIVYNPVNANTEEKISFQIKKGETLKEIGKNLEKKELIKSPSIFYLYAKHNNYGEKVLAGRFVLNQAMNIPEILEAISDASQVETIITIQEGLKIRDIDNKLTNDGFINEGEFILAVKNFNGWEYYDFLDETTLKKLDLPLEGYIYPDTYFIDPESFKPNTLIYMALDNFEKKIQNIEIHKTQQSLENILIMASILEKEVRSQNDKEIVAGILWKRLANGWTLGADATLLYEKTDNKITTADLNNNSPYNTRIHKGLPPSPICNPSIESIKAALNPKETEYWFYLNAKADGKTIFAINNEDHNKNRSKYL